MADNIGSNITDIIDAASINQQIGLVMAKIDDLSAKITATNENHLEIQVDAKGVDNLAALNKILVDYAGFVKQANGVTEDAAEVNDIAKQKIADLGKQIQAVESAWAKFGKTNEQVNAGFEDQISKLNKQIQDLGGAITGTTNVFATQINVTDKAANSLGALRQQMVQLIVAGKEGTQQFADLTKQALAYSDANYKVVQSTQAVTKEMDAAQAERIALEQKGEQIMLAELQAAENERTQIRIKNKIAAEAESQAEIASNEKVERRVLENELRKTEAAQDGARKRVLADEQAAAKGIAAAEKQTLAYQMMAKAKNMALRFPALLAEIAILTLLFEAVEKITKAFTELSPAEQLATDRIKEFAEFAKELNDFQANFTSAMTIQKDAIETNMAILTDHTTSIEAKTKAYKDLQEIMPGVMKNYKLEEIAAGGIPVKLRQQANFVAEQLAAIKTNKGIYDKELVELQKAKELYDLGDTEPENHTGAHQLQLDQIRTNYDNLTRDVALRKKEIQDAQLSIANYVAPEIKEKKAKGPNDKGMDAELALAKAQYDKEVALNQQRFEASKKFDVDELNLSRDNNVAANKYGEEQVKIIIAWHGKTGELEKKYLARIEEANNSILKADNKATDEQKAIYARMVKDYEEFRDKMTQLRQLNDELDTIKAGEKRSSKRASGASGFLAGFGFDEDFKESQAEKQRKIDDAVKTLQELQQRRNELANSPNRNQQTDKEIDTMDMIDIPKAGNDVEGATADKQAERDQKIFEMKKQIATDSVRLVQTTIESIKQIQDNQFAHEQQQLQIKMQQVQLHSEQELRAIDAEAGFQITKDNQKAKVAAQTTAEENALTQKQNELLLKKAKADKEYAEMSVIANTAAAIMKVWVGYADQGEVGAALAAAETAILAGIGAAQYAAAASAPLPQFAEGGITTTPFFIAGEAGPEIISAPGKAPYITDAARIHHEPIGTEVIPIDRMYEYAIANASRGSYQQNMAMEQAYQNEVISKELAKIVGEKFEDVGAEVVKAVWGARARVPDSGKSYENSLRYQYRLK